MLFAQHPLVDSRMCANSDLNYGDPLLVCYVTDRDTRRFRQCSRRLARSRACPRSILCTIHGRSCDVLTGCRLRYASSILGYRTHNLTADFHIEVVPLGHYQIDIDTEDACDHLVCEASGRR